MTWRWSITPEAAWPPFVQAQVDAVEADIVKLVESMTETIAADMRQEAPWTDRTGLTRASLFAALLHEARQIVGILVSHGSLIEWAVYLELGFAGRFAILAPTVDRWGPVFFRGVQEIVRRRLG